MTNKTIDQAIQECIGVIDMCRYRNGKHSAENLFADKLTTALEQYFNNQRININTLVIDNPEFAKHFGITC